MGRADYLVVAPAISIGVLPIPAFARDLTVATGELFQFLGLEEVQSVEQVAHLVGSLLVGPRQISGVVHDILDQGFWM